MYRHILIPTDGSELAEHAVTNGLSLAKSVGAKVTVIIVQEPFDWLSVPETRASQRQHFENLAKHNEQVEKHAAAVLSRAAEAQPSRPVCPATRCRWRTRDPIKPLLQQPRTGAAISSSWHRTGAAGSPQSCSGV
jgi:nucleotide-binding universal stress UspA family protein